MPRAETALLRLPGFSRFACSTLLSTIAFAGEQVVLGWLALELTNSPLLVGVALALRMVPLLIVGLPAGVLADRGDRLALLRGANATMSLAFTVLENAMVGRHCRSKAGPFGAIARTAAVRREEEAIREGARTEVVTSPNWPVRVKSWPPGSKVVSI